MNSWKLPHTILFCLVGWFTVDFFAGAVQNVLILVLPWIIGGLRFVIKCSFYLLFLVSLSVYLNEKLKVILN